MSSVNVDRQVSDAIQDSIVHEQKCLGVVTDSPFVIKKERLLMCGQISGGSSCTEFAYGCCCHSLPNFVKQRWKDGTIKTTIEKTIKVGQLFCNTHVANDLLRKAKMGMEKPPESIKSFSTTRWNVVADLLRSVIANKTVIGSVLKT